VKTKILMAALFVLIPLSVNAFKNEPDGFRGIKWGTNIKDLKDMKLVIYSPPHNKNGLLFGLT
jgi:hypothetical protein